MHQLYVNSSTISRLHRKADQIMGKYKKNAQGGKQSFIHLVDLDQIISLNKIAHWYKPNFVLLLVMQINFYIIQK